MGTIKINNQSIAKLYLGNIAVKRAYSNGSIVYDTGIQPTPQPCFEVVETITDATGNFVDVYAKDTEKWYKRNNLNQYEEYGIMPEVADLSTLTYYVGKLAICTTDAHEYKWNGNTWVDLGSCITNVIFLDPSLSSSTRYNFPVEYYFGTGYKLRVLLYLTGSFSGDTGGIFNNHEHSPIKVSFYREGYYFDSHYPTSTTEPATNNPNYSNRVYKSEVFTNDYKNRFMIMEVQMNKIAFYDYNTGTELTDIGGGSVATVTGWYNGLYYTVYNPNATNPVHAAYFQVVDNNGNVVNDIRPVLNNGEIVLHDSIINVDYNKTSGTVQYHTEPIGQITPVEEYDTKVAPANNVHYNTLAELELMECPWNGMQATIGQNYELYLYWNNQWNKLGMPCFEAVDTISQATGNYIDVYVTSESKWYKKNNISQYEEYGIMPSVADLSTLTYYVGKLAICTTDKHEYRWNGSSWTDLGNAGTFKNYIFIDPAENSSQNVSYNFKYYFANDYKMKFLFYLTPDYSYTLDFSLIAFTISPASGYGTGPIEFNFYSNGFYFDSHYPISGYNGRYYEAGDYSNRVMQQSVLNNHKGKYIIAEIMLNKVTLYDYETGAVIGTYGRNYTSSNWGTELSANYLIIESLLRLNYGTAKHPVHLGYIKVYDKNDNLVNNISFVPDENQKIYMHDSIADQDYTSPSTLSFNYHTENVLEYNPPVDYDEKVPPANNVHYSTLEELELMECPWIGMMATVGQEYTAYVYTEDGWVLGDVPLNLPYLRFTALEDTTFTFKKSNLAAADLEIKYSIDGGVWKSMEFGVATPIVTAGSYVVLKSNFKGYNTVDFMANGRFSSTGKFNLSGNIMSLIYGDEFVGKTSLANYKCVFGNLFYNCTKLKSISYELLPATTLSISCYYKLFNGCTGLTSIPANLLQTTTLAERCYKGMFNGCTGITSIPENLLPATTLSTQCYCEMFMSSGVTSIPSGLLHSTNLANSCYSNMFSHSNVNSIPENLLPATTLAGNCYYALFRQTKITSIPYGLLQATNLADNCYSNMFYGCTSLKSANIELPATTVNNMMAYHSMFYNCTNLLDPPIIKATSVSGKNSFAYMFYGCSKMNYLICDMLNEPSSSISKNWLSGVAATGTFYKNPNATWDQTITKGADTVPTGWNINEISEPEYLKFTTVDDNGSTYAFSKEGLEYSIDGGAWTTLAANTNTPNIPKNSNIRFRGNLMPNGSDTIGRFSSSGKFNAEGELMTLLYGEYYVDQTGKYANDMFQYMFLSTKIVNAYNLVIPYNSGSYNYSCYYMFNFCSELEVAPKELKGNTYVGNYSFYQMFGNCPKLTKTPIIWYTFPAYDAMTNMFVNDTLLNEVCLLQTGSGNHIDASRSYNWLRGVAATGTFYANQNLTWVDTIGRGTSTIPSGWTIVKVDPGDY